MKKNEKEKLELVLLTLQVIITIISLDPTLQLFIILLMTIFYDKI